MTTNWIYAYSEAIRNGEVTVGKYIKQLYTIIIHGLESGEYKYNDKKAQRAITFIETFCRHSEGRNDLLKLELWQKAAVSLIFGIVDDNNLRVFREVFIVVARKNGKTLFASAIMAYMVYLDGEYGAKVYCIAPKLEQAEKAYDGFYQMVRSDPELGDKSVTIKRRSDIYIPETNCSVKPLAFSAKKSDGFNPQLVVCDEIASWQGMAGLRQYNAMKSARGSRKQPLILSISTAGYVDDSIYDELMKRSTSFLSGNSKERRLLPILYIIDDPNKWNDMTELRKSNPNLNVSVTEDFYREEILAAETSSSIRAEFLTKYCNIKQNASVAWLDYQVVATAANDTLTLDDFRDSYCVGGIDLSQTTDLTACSVVIERDNKLYAFCQYFMPRERIRTLQEEDGVPYELYVTQGIITPSGDNYVDYHDCFDWFVTLVEEYKILPLKIGYDRYSAQYLINDLDKYGFHTDDVFQGENLTPVIQEFEGILRDNNFYICGGNNLLKTHFLNVALKQNVETRRVRPVKIGATEHIDGFVSVIDAMTVRQKYYSEIGIQLKNAG